MFQVINATVTFCCEILPIVVLLTRPYFQYIDNQAVPLLRREHTRYIFVPEVDWCSTNINQKSKSIENSHFPIQEKPKQSPVSVNFFLNSIPVTKPYPKNPANKMASNLSLENNYPWN